MNSTPSCKVIHHEICLVCNKPTQGNIESAIERLARMSKKKTRIACFLRELSEELEA